MADTSGGITTVRAESPLIKKEEPERSNDHWLKLHDEDDQESKLKAGEDSKEIKIKIKAYDGDEEKSKIKADEDTKEIKSKADDDDEEIKFKVNHEDSKGDSDNESIYGGDTEPANATSNLPGYDADSHGDSDSELREISGIKLEIDDEGADENAESDSDYGSTDGGEIEPSDWADDSQVDDGDYNNGSDDDDDSDDGSSGGTRRPKRSRHRWSNNASQPDFEDRPGNQCPCGTSHLPTNCPERLLETCETDAIPTINNPSPITSMPLDQNRNIPSQPEENIPIDPALSDPTRPACTQPEPPAATPSRDSPCSVEIQSLGTQAPLVTVQRKRKRDRRRTLKSTQEPTATLDSVQVQYRFFCNFPGCGQACRDIANLRTHVRKHLVEEPDWSDKEARERRPGDLKGKIYGCGKDGCRMTFEDLNGLR